MTELILFLVICALSVLIGYLEYQNRKERQRLVNTIISRTAQDLANFDLAEKVTKIDPNPPLVDSSGFIEESELDDKDFQRYSINKEEVNA